MLLNKISPFLLLGCLSAVFAETVVHDGQFKPDHVLRVTVAQVPSACENRDSVVVNGTSPGPTIHLLPGTRTWIRVYNDIPDQNLTMVSEAETHFHGRTNSADGTPSIGMVSPNGLRPSRTVPSQPHSGPSRPGISSTTRLQPNWRTPVPTSTIRTLACRR